MSQTLTDIAEIAAPRKTHKPVSKKAISAPQALNEAFTYQRPSSF